MERGQLIAYHRKRLHLTQAELGEKVNVTAQAVSKWENGLSEPDLSTIQRLGKIFEIDIKEFFAEEPTEQLKQGGEASPSATIQEEAAPAAANEGSAAEAVQPKIIVGYCERCKRPIDQREKYTVEHHGRGTGTQYLYCPACKHEMEVSNANYEYRNCKDMFKRSMIWGGVVAGAVALAFIVLTIVYTDPLCLLGLVLSAMAFTFTAQCFWDGFIVEFLEFFVHCFRMPMLIFSLDLDGIIWFITVKLTLMLLSGLLSVLLLILGFFLTLIVSLFVFPFCLIAKVHQMKKLKANAEHVKTKKV